MKIAICRFTPFDLKLKSYNVQEVGMSKAFCDKGFDVDLIVFKSIEQSSYQIYENNGNRVMCIELPRYRVFRWGINCSILKKEFWQQYEFVVCFEYMEIMSYWVSKLTHKVLLYSGPYYNLFTIKPISPLYDTLVIGCYNKVLLGNFTKSVLAQQYLESKGCRNVHTIGVGLDIERFQGNATIQTKTKELVDFMKNNSCIMYVGALSSRKNFPFLLDVFKKVHEKNSNVKLLMIGKSSVPLYKRIIGKDGDSYYQKYFNKLSRSEKEGIVHIEKIDNDQLQFIYPLAKAFLLPSKLEIFGMVLLEALYFGAPVISSKNGGSMTLIYGKETGVMINEFDVNKWRDAVICYIENDEFREKMVKNGKVLVQTKFTWNHIVSEMLKVIS